VAYIESACCLLFYDSFRDRCAVDSNAASLEEALDCLKKMVLNGPVPGVISTLEQMLLELGQAKASESSDLTMDGIERSLARSSQHLEGQSFLQQWPLPDLSHDFNNGAYLTSTFNADWTEMQPFMDIGYDQNLFVPNLGELFNPSLHDRA
jgi:hypothetical protein